MKRNRYIIILLMLLLIFIMIFLLFNNNEKKIEKNNKVDILDEFSTKKDLLIYVSSDKDSCLWCHRGNEIINFYEYVYDLKFIRMDEGKELDRVLKKLNITDDLILPALIFVKDGNMSMIINELSDEDLLSEYLIEYNYMNNENFDNHIDDNKFLEIYSSSNKSMTLVISSDNYSYNFRKKIFDLASKYKFQYNVMFFGIENNIDSISLINKELGDDASYPIILITKDSKIIDYTTSNNTKEIREFLVKNKIINS